MDHIRMLGGDCQRINSFDILNKPINLSLNNDFVSIGEKIIDPDNIGAVWFRKFGFFRRSQQALNHRKFLEPTAQSYMATEFSKVIGVFENYFSNSFWLTNPNRILLNKFLVLKRAQLLGLLIPPTYIVNNLQELINIKKKELRLISKSIYDPLIIQLGRESYSMYTTEIKEEDMLKLPNFFLPSMVQKAIPKQFELRVFYLMGKCYSMAIMSQEDKETSVDYRKYNFKNPNRFLPYDLPNDIEQKIIRLMDELSLNTGSIDLILTPDNEYVFLEVNPTGQFGMVDYSCNYGLHEKVAKLLICEDKKKCYEKSY